MLILLLRGAGPNVWLLLPEFSVVRLPVVLGAFALGAATPSLLHALTLAAIGAGVSIATILLGSHLLSGGYGSDTRQPLSAPRSIVALWFIAVVFATVAVVQFLTRREGFSRCLFASGIAAAVVVQLVWPWDVLDRRLRDGAAGAPIELRIDPASITFDSVEDSVPREEPWRQVSAAVEIGSTNLLPGRFLAPIASRVGLVSATASHLTGLTAYGVRPADESYLPTLRSDFSQRGIEMILPGERGAPDHSHRLTHTLAMADDQFEGLRRDLEQISIAVDVGEFEINVVGELPLHDGAAWQDRGDELEIIKAQAMPDSLRIRVREQQLLLTFSPRNAQGRRHNYPWVLVLANRETKTAILLNRNDSQMSYRGASWLSPFLTGEEMIEVNLRYSLGGDFTPQASDHWLHNSTLIIMRRSYLGSLRAEQSTNATQIHQIP
jgi:hypothetical protein